MGHRPLIISTWRVRCFHAQRSQVGVSRGCEPTRADQATGGIYPVIRLPDSSLSPKHRGGPEALCDQVDAERELPNDLGDGHQEVRRIGGLVYIEQRQARRDEEEWSADQAEDRQLTRQEA